MAWSLPPVMPALKFQVPDVDEHHEVRRELLQANLSSWLYQHLCTSVFPSNGFAWHLRLKYSAALTTKKRKKKGKKERGKLRVLLATTNTWA